MILFVCAGNICRSAMAQGMAAAQRPDLEFESAGTHAREGLGATEFSVRAAAEAGGDIGTHRARPITAEILETAERVYCMTGEQRRWLIERFPAHEPRITLLDPGGGDIRDPYGGDLDEYRRVRDQIMASIAVRRSESEGS